MVHQQIEVIIIYRVVATLEFSEAQKKRFYDIQYLCTKYNVMKYIMFYYINFNKPLTLICHGIYV
jgi:hypothetical protein